MIYIIMFDAIRCYMLSTHTTVAITLPFHCVFNDNRTVMFIIRTIVRCVRNNGR